MRKRLLVLAGIMLVSLTGCIARRPELNMDDMVVSDDSSGTETDSTDEADSGDSGTELNEQVEVGEIHGLDNTVQKIKSGLGNGRKFCYIDSITPQESNGTKWCKLFIQGIDLSEEDKEMHYYTYKEGETEFERGTALIIEESYANEQGYLMLNNPVVCDVKEYGDSIIWINKGITGSEVIKNEFDNMVLAQVTEAKQARAEDNADSAGRVDIRQEVTVRYIAGGERANEFEGLLASSSGVSGGDYDLEQTKAVINIETLYDQEAKNINATAYEFKTGDYFLIKGDTFKGKTDNDIWGWGDNELLRCEVKDNKIYTTTDDPAWNNKGLEGLSAIEEKEVQFIE